MKKKNDTVSFTTAEEFHAYTLATAKSGETAFHSVNTPAIIKGSGLAEKDESGELRVVISTAARDRDRDTIDPAGWDLTNYKKNPVILFAHDHSRPVIGRALKTYIEDGKLVSIPEFMPEDMDPFAASIGKMVAGGWMKATSVGFMPLEWVFNEEEHGVDFSKQELMEYSVVPVPSNPQALVEAKRAKIDLAPVKQWAEETLDRFAEKGFDISLSRELVEKLYDSIDNNHKTIIAPEPKTVTVGSFEVTFNDTDAAGVSAHSHGGAVAVTPPAGHATGNKTGGLSSPPAPSVKSGRILSKDNEAAIRSAHKALGDVLAKLEKEEIIEEPQEEPAAAEPVADPEPKSVSAAELSPQAWFESLANNEGVLALNDEKDEDEVLTVEQVKELLKPAVTEEAQKRITKLTGKVF